MWRGPLLLVTEEGEVLEVPEATVLLAATTGVVDGDGDDLMCDSGMVGGGGGSSYRVEPPPFIMDHQLPPGHPAAATSCSPYSGAPASPRSPMMIIFVDWSDVEGKRGRSADRRGHTWACGRQTRVGAQPPGNDHRFDTQFVDASRISRRRKIDMEKNKRSTRISLKIRHHDTIEILVVQIYTIRSTSETRIPLSGGGGGSIPRTVQTMST